jgi:hypothetical protein
MRLYFQQQLRNGHARPREKLGRQFPATLRRRSRIRRCQWQTQTHTQRLYRCLAVLPGNWQQDVRNCYFSADPKPVDVVWGSLRELGSAEPPWKRASAAASSSSLISRDELDGENAGVASSPWEVSGYIDTLLTEMRTKRKVPAEDIPDPHQDSMREMCHHAYHAWLDSLHDYVWPMLCTL